ncbi:DegT/DnrJ/EryC1/StrS family aminotransferase [bacterium]|nr:DegT/DnrJ/EryC1/StrS family aminotransferase [bacterium]
MSSPVNVPLLDLRKQYDEIADEIQEVLEPLLRSQTFILGPEVDALEKELADYCQTEFALGVSSGTDALLMSLMALEIGPGHEVITSPYTFFATAGSVTRVGAKPVFVDIDPVTFNIDPNQIEERITPRTKAIMPVHLYGQCADMEAINDIARRHHLSVIEDAAQSIGAEYMGQRAGSLGTVGALSFFPSKNLGAFGDAGAVVTQDRDLYEKMKSLRMHGQSSTYYHQYVGGNFRIDALQAAVLRVKLRHLDRWTLGRQKNAAFYAQALNDRGLAGQVLITPKVTTDRHVFNQFVVRLLERDAVQKQLDAAGIGVRVYYPLSLHMQPCFASLGYQKGDFPESELAAECSLALPVYPELSLIQQQRVVECLVSYYQTQRSSTRRAA